MRVPFLDLRAGYAELRSDIDNAISEVLAHGHYILGPQVSAFEAEYAGYVGSRFCVGVGNGLDALHLALRAFDVGPGDEVLVPSNTYIATWLAVSMCGALPVPVEPTTDTMNMDPSRLEAAVSSRSRVVMPVHLYGQPVDMKPILEIARRYDLRVVDDAAQAHGAKYRGERVGNLADATAWSFYPGKNLGAFGDGGAVTTSDKLVAERVARLRNYGSRSKYINEELGFNSRLDELQAAVLRVKLRVLDDWNSRRSAIANLYRQGLAGTGLRLPEVLDGVEPSWHLYVVRTAHRDALVEALQDRGIEILVHYPVPPHLQGAYSESGFLAGSFPKSERIHDQVLSLPIGPHLTIEQAEYIIAETRAVLPNILTQD